MFVVLAARRQRPMTNFDRQYADVGEATQELVSVGVLLFSEIFLNLEVFSAAMRVVSALSE
jgi:hypothetical protein